MGSLDYEGLASHYTDEGDGTPLVLLHAGASSSRQWRKVEAELTGHYRRLAPDLIGFGQTEHWERQRELTHDDQAGLVLELLAQTTDEPVVLVGHSYGGATAIRVALARPELIRSLVLIEPITMPLLPQAGEHELWADYEALARGFIARVDAGEHLEAMQFFIDHRNGAGTWAATSEDARARLLAAAPSTADAFRSNLNNPTTLKDCRSIGIPTLVARGENTTAPERRLTEILSAELPRCRYAVIDGAGHMSPLSHPGEVAHLIDQHAEVA